VNAGALDRRLRFERASDTQGPSGEPSRTWSPLIEVAARKRELGGRELFQAQQLVAKVDTEFLIRYPVGMYPFPTPSELLRLVCEGRTYDITHVSEIGRRDGLRILAFARADQDVAA